MALSPVTPLSSQPYFPPAPRGPQAISSHDIEDLENSDPKLSMRKQLLDAMFGTEDEDESNSDVKLPGEGEAAPQVPAQAAGDTVQISAQAVELHRRESVDITVESADGQRLRVSYERETGVRIEQVQAEVKQSDPLVVDLGGNGLDLTDVRTGAGVRFDITGDGTAETVSWVAPSDGLLALDRNGNGMIDNGRELFGDQNGAANGFAELASYDADGNGRIDTSDGVFSALRIWQDANQDGVSDAGELSSLDKHGISALSVRPTRAQDTVAGNLVDAYAAYTGPGGSGRVGEAALNYLA